MDNGLRRNLTARLERCYTGAVHDALRSFGLKRQALPPAIRLLDPQRAVAGCVFPISGRLADVDERTSLLKWTQMLSQVPSDYVAVCQPRDETIAHMGELSAETLKLRNVRGWIVDGGCRDTHYIQRSGFPVACRYHSPADIVGRWLVESLGEPISIGDVQIALGDFVLADQDGVIIVPGEVAERTVNEAERMMQTESLVRKAILSGMDPKEAYLTYGKF